MGSLILDAFTQIFAKFSQQAGSFYWWGAYILCINCAYAFEPLILQHINVNISYATQAMAGIISSSLVSYFLFQEKTGTKGMIGLFLAVVSFGLMLWDSFESRSN